MTVSAAGATPTGTVNVYDGSTLVTSATLANGSATARVAVKPGSHVLHAGYVGTDSVQGSTSPDTAVTVSKASSKTTLTASPGKIAHGGAVTLKVKVSASGTTPTGSVTLRDAQKKLQKAALKKGSATIKLKGLTASSYRFQASYAGSSLVGASSSKQATVSVRKQPKARR